MSGVGLTAAALVVGCVCTTARAFDNEYLTNAGFEVYEDTVGFLPDEFGNWQGDQSEILSSTQDGIVPFEGVEMLQFQGSTMSGADLGTVGSEVWQLIDISSFVDQVRSGQAVLNASVYFNRVSRDGKGPGDAETDTQFSVVMAAYAGTPQDFSAKWISGSQLDGARADLFSDDDTRTWEMAAVKLLLPTNTDYVAIRIAATENIMDDWDAPEFDGHYADGSAVWLIPTPGSAALLFAGCGLGFGGLSRRRRSTTG
ncbi:MAG: hypothetical protein D8M59_06765 [Planctomycetes bacterium]|nr:hypothetical protein [Planctomycetota bacterium]